MKIELGTTVPVNRMIQGKELVINSEKRAN